MVISGIVLRSLRWPIVNRGSCRQFVLDGAREVVGNVEAGNGDQAGQPLVGGIAEPLDDLRLRQHHAAAPLDIVADEFAGLGARLLAALHLPVLQRLLLDRPDAAAAASIRLEDADQTLPLLGELADWPGGVFDAVLAFAGGDRFDLRQHAVTEAECQRFAARPPVGDEQHPRRFAIAGAIPRNRLAEQFAVAIAADDVDHRDAGDLATPADALFRARQQPFVGEFLQQPLQFDAVGALDAEGSSDLALADLVGRVGDELEDLVLGRQAAGRLQPARAHLRLGKALARRTGAGVGGLCLRATGVPVV